MPANSNAPIGTLPWRLTAASPGTLDILVDVESPISWEIGGEVGGQVLNPFYGELPIITGRGASTYGRKGKFKIFIPDTEDRDDVIEALINERLSPTAPYYTWRAMDGGASWKVMFSTAEAMNIGYLSGHRVVDLTFIQVAANQDNGATAATAPLPAVPGAPPSVTSQFSQVQQLGNIYVTWANIVANSPGDFIAVYRSTGLNIPPDINGLNYGRLAISTKNGTGTIVFNDPDTAFTNYQIWLYTGVGPQLIPGPLLTRAIDLTFNIVNPVDNNDILGPGASFVLNWVGIPNPSPIDHVVFGSTDPDGNDYDIGSFPTDGSVGGSLTVPVPTSIPKATYAAYAAARFSLVLANSPEVVRVGRMAPVYVNINIAPAGNTVTANWGGLNSVAGGDAIGIIPAIDTNLTSAYAQITLPTGFGSHAFSLPDVPNGTYVKACLKVGSTFYISEDVFMVEN